MNYSLIAAEKWIAYMRFLPEHVQQAVRQNQTCVICGFNEENEITCIGVFSYAAINTREAELLYLYTREQHQGQGWAAGLLAYAEKMFTFAGITRLSCTLTGEMGLVNEVSEFLKAHSFVPQMANQHMYIYSFEQIAKCKRLMAYKSGTYKFHCEKEKLRLILLQDTQIPPEIRYIIEKETDVANSLFYIKNNKLMMAILIGLEQSQYHFIKTIYLNPDMKKKEIVVSMLSHMTEGMLVKDAEHDRVCFHINKDRYGEFCKNMFGEPQKDYLIQKYGKKISD